MLQSRSTVVVVVAAVAGLRSSVESFEPDLADVVLAAAAVRGLLDVRPPSLPPSRWTASTIPDF